MNPMGNDPDACRRIADAIAEGRFLEDPALWRPHVETCAACRTSVEGLFALRERVRLAGLESPVVEPRPSREGALAIALAFRQHRHERTIRNVSAGILLLLAASIGFFVVRRAPPEASETAFAYARRLNAMIVPASGSPDHERLARDAAARAEFLAALDHPSSCVRRTALYGLLNSRIPVDPARLEKVLTEFHEDLEIPVETASVSDDGRAVADALRGQRAATVLSALIGLDVTPETGVPRVRSEVVASFLSDPEPPIRRQALIALRADARYVPDATVERLMRGDPDREVAVFAADLLVLRRGEEGASLVVDRLRKAPDPVIERMLVSALAPTRVGLELAHERVADPTTDPALALAQAITLYDRAPKHEFAPPEAVIDRALHAPTRLSFEALAYLCIKANWTMYRARLQAMWRGLSREDRDYGGRDLVAWDLTGVADEARLTLALDICEADRSSQERAAVVTMSTNPSALIRQRAERLLASWPEKPR